ncbi:WD repeat-containing protein 93-like isoform X3 [Pecten maximus]|uniref:WD repeat-containing protein 93-like isoform X3 n=1 Tax=Pecten maximus TaxID=6579 RepID=UPI0014580FD0|nr:WD repeat-containing protein 93-like isoform X3 [Pecten maximus]
MPVYLRKNVNYTPPSLDQIPVEQEDDYVQDPEQLKDHLPQPYRMLDKVLNKVFEDAWAIIEQRENAALEEARRFKPPQFDYEEAVEPLGGATSINCSSDGKIVFVGLPNGIAVLDSVTRHRICAWEEDKVEIIRLKTYPIAESMHLIVSLDDMGLARLHAFAGERLFLLKLLNEAQEEKSSTRLLIHKCEASAEGEYLGSLVENPTSAEVWLEIYRLPRDEWIQEIEKRLADAQKELEKKEGKSVEEPPTPAATEEGDGDAEQQAPENQPETTPHPPSHPDKAAKFSQISLVMKLKPPPTPTGNLAPSIHGACQKVDSGEVIGTGQNHILTTSHLDLRTEIFENNYKHMLDYLPKEEKMIDLIRDVNFHFMTSGRLMHNPQESPNNPGSPTNVAVWWQNSTHLYHYSLFKQAAKDGEMKPDLVWPFTSKITATTMSTDSNLLVIGLASGNIVVWDRYLGMQRGVVNVTTKAAIQQMWFLDPSLCPQDVSNYPPYATKTTAYLLVQSSDGAMFYLMCGAGLPLEPYYVSPPVEKEENMFTRVDPIPGKPELTMVVLKKGTIQIRHTLHGNVLCETKLPPTHQVVTPWDPIITTACRGERLFVRGEAKEEKPAEQEDEKQEPEKQEPQPEVEPVASMMFVFGLKQFAPLEEFMVSERTSVPFTVHTTIDKRVDALMTERIAQQALRKTRMQDRWGLMKEEIWAILQYKEQAERKADQRPVYNYQTVYHYEQDLKTPGSIGWGTALFN